MAFELEMHWHWGWSKSQNFHFNMYIFISMCIYLYFNVFLYSNVYTHRNKDIHQRYTHWNENIHHVEMKIFTFLYGYFVLYSSLLSLVHWEVLIARNTPNTYIFNTQYNTYTYVNSRQMDTIIKVNKNKTASLEHGILNQVGNCWLLGDARRCYHI